MTVNDQHQFVFVHIPKNAGTSLRTALGVLEGNSTKGVAETKHETGKEFLDSYAARTGEASDQVKAYQFLCFTRHPVKRFASLHRYLIKTHRHVYPQVPKSLNHFAEVVSEGAEWTEHIRSIRPQHLYVDGIASPWIERVETLEADFARLCTDLGVSLTLGHRNATIDATNGLAFLLSPRNLPGRLKRARRESSYVAEDLSLENTKLLEKIYAKDFEIFNYPTSN